MIQRWAIYWQKLELLFKVVYTKFMTYLLNIRRRLFSDYFLNITAKYVLSKIWKFLSIWYIIKWYLDTDLIGTKQSFLKFHITVSCCRILFLSTFIKEFYGCQELETKMQFKGKVSNLSSILRKFSVWEEMVFCVHRMSDFYSHRLCD